MIDVCLRLNHGTEKRNISEMKTNSPGYLSEIDYYPGRVNNNNNDNNSFIAIHMIHKGNSSVLLKKTCAWPNLCSCGNCPCENNINVLKHNTIHEIGVNQYWTSYFDAYDLLHGRYICFNIITKICHRLKGGVFIGYYGRNTTGVFITIWCVRDFRLSMVNLMSL